MNEKHGFSHIREAAERSVERHNRQIDRDCRDTSRQDALLVVAVLIVCVCVLVSVRGG